MEDQKILAQYTSRQEENQPCCETCQNKNECKKEVYQEEKSEDYSSDEDIIGKDYTLINIETNFYDFHKGINKIGSINKRLSIKSYFNRLKYGLSAKSCSSNS